MPMNLSVYRVAKDSGIAQSTLAAIVTGHRSVSPETATRLGLYFGVDAQFWLNLQTRYGLMMLDDRRQQIEKQVRPLELPLPAHAAATTQDACQQNRDDTG